MTHQSTYRDILQESFDSRVSQNRAYSLRAFARDIGLSPTSLSMVLNGKQGLSQSSAARIAQKMGLSDLEQERFIDLALLEHARNMKDRERARIRLRKYDTAETHLSLEAFRVMCDWYHFAILELTELDDFESSPQWIARALGITENTAVQAIERLIKLELLEKSGKRLRQTKGFLATPSGIPSDALKKFHSQLLERASRALYEQSVQERDFSSLIFAIDVKDLPWAKEEIKKFRRQFMARLEQASRKNRLYCFSAQFYGLSDVSEGAEGSFLHSKIRQFQRLKTKPGEQK